MSGPQRKQSNQSFFFFFKLKRETTIFYTKKEREINNPSVCGCETPRRSAQLEFFHIFICENMVSFLYWFQWKNTFCEIMKVSFFYLFVFLATKKASHLGFCLFFLFYNKPWLSPIRLYLESTHTFLRLLWDNDCIGLSLNSCSNTTDI